MLLGHLCFFFSKQVLRLLNWGCFFLCFLYVLPIVLWSLIGGSLIKPCKSKGSICSCECAAGPHPFWLLTLLSSIFRLFPWQTRILSVSSWQSVIPWWDFNCLIIQWNTYASSLLIQLQAIALVRDIWSIRLETVGAPQERRTSGCQPSSSARD